VKEGRKQFFFEKKNQKTFAFWLSRRLAAGRNANPIAAAKKIKVFWSFFSKKDCFSS
jgi:hypothetical protein